MIFRMVQKFCFRFVTIHGFDRQTDGRTEFSSLGHVYILQRGKNQFPLSYRFELYACTVRIFMFTASLPRRLACHFNLTTMSACLFCILIYTIRHARSSLARSRAIWRMALGCSKQVFVRRGGVLCRWYVTSWTNRWAAAVTATIRDSGIKYGRARGAAGAGGFAHLVITPSRHLFDPTPNDALTTDNFRSKCVVGRVKWNTQVIINGICWWRLALRPTFYS